METPKVNELPVVFLSFANNQDRYLPLLSKEANSLFEILHPLQTSNQYEIYKEEGVDLNDLFNAFRRFRNRIEIFHYGGHANSTHLHLEGQEADSNGLAELFKIEPNLKLIFLNGCSTKSQVDQLLENGVPAVIGTSVEVNDEAAVDFSIQFYKELVSGSTLKIAFDVASAYLMSKYSKKKRPSTEVRSLGESARGGLQNEDVLPWGLYIGKDHKDILEWRLVDGQQSNRIDYESLKSISFQVDESVVSSEIFQANQYLTSFVLEGINKLGDLGDQEISIENLKALLESFPAPISLKLQPLIYGPLVDFDLERLRQLISAYREIMRFIAFTYLAQLIKIIETRNGHLSNSNVLLTRFLGLNEQQSETFDFLQIALEIDQIFQDHEIDPWVKEQSRILKSMENEEMKNIHFFIRKLYPLVSSLDSSIPEDITLLCKQTEYCLGMLIKKVAFYIRYDLILVKKELIASKPMVKKGKKISSEQKIEAETEFVFSKFQVSRLYQRIQLNDSFDHPSVRLIRTVNDMYIDVGTYASLIADGLKNGLDMSYFLSGELLSGNLGVFAYRSTEHQYFSELKMEYERYPMDFLTNENPNYYNFDEILEIDEVRQSPKRFRYANYNSDAPDGEDHLEIMPDVRAFANLIASQDLKPPLSIGLFGDWGSGKSFFMTKLRKEVAEYERIAKRELEKSANLFLEELEEIAEENTRQAKILSLFPDPKTQIDQIRDWIKVWEKKRDPSSLRSLGRVFGVNPKEIKEMMLAGTLKEHTEESILFGKLVDAQHIEASNLAREFSLNNEAVSKMIGSLAELKAEPELGYCRNIAQIEFNAWHYIDTNLWASLITNILEDLNTYVGNLPNEEKQHLQLYKDLATTHKLKLVVENEIEAIQGDIKTIELDLVELDKQKSTAEKELKEIKFKDAIDVLLAEDENAKAILTEIKNKGNEAYKEIGLDEFDVNLSNAENQVRTLGNEISSTWTRMKAWKLSFQDLSFLGKSFFIFFLVAPILAFWILPYVLEDSNSIKIFVDNIKTFFSPFLQTSVPIFAILADGVLVGRKVLGRINKAADQLDDAKVKLDKLKNLASSKYQKEIKEKELELEGYLTALEEAKKRKTAHGNREEELKKDLAEIEDGKRLSAYIERRLLSDDYQQHLGLISLIREDFERLTSYLHGRGFYTKVINRIQGLINTGNPDGVQNNSPFDLEKIDTIDRIVLYIDDLDRCPPDKVVQVLQAIHLILAFPLFVVVVGVDVRWVSRSLSKEYGSMLSKTNVDSWQNKAGHAHNHNAIELQYRDNASPFDYIEKIFQIPFQLKNMSNDDKEYFIGKLLEDDMKQAKVAKESFTTENGLNQEFEVEFEKEISNIFDASESNASDANVDQSQKEEKVKKQDSNISETNTTKPERQIPVLANLQRLEKVSLNTREINFIKAMSPILAGSPRTVKRFVNVCRLIKSHATWGKSERELDGKLTRYETMIFILGLVTGIPNFTRFIFEKLESEDPEKTFQDLINSVDEELVVLKKMKESNVSLNNKKEVQRAIENNKVNGISAISINRLLNLEDLIKEWERFHKVWGISKATHGIIPEKDDSNPLLIKDFCSKKLKDIKPHFMTAVRFSFRFIEY